MKKLEKAKLKVRAVETLVRARAELNEIADAIDPEVPSSDNFVRDIDSVLKVTWELLSRLGVDPMNGVDFPGAAGQIWRDTVELVRSEERREEEGG